MAINKLPQNLQLQFKFNSYVVSYIKSQKGIGFIEKNLLICPNLTLIRTAILFYNYEYVNLSLLTLRKILVLVTHLQKSEYRTVRNIKWQNKPKGLNFTQQIVQTKFYRLAYNYILLFNTFNDVSRIRAITLFNRFENIFFIFYILNKYFNYCVLSEYTAVDYLGYKPKFFYTQSNHARFMIYYIVLSLCYNTFLTINLFCNSIEHKAKLNPKVCHTALDKLPSLITIYAAANWPEREIWDLFGLIFLEHPDLRRILTDYGFNSFPLRKDFPICGYLELHYDEEYKVLLYEPVEFSQEYRDFSFLNPWDQFEVQ